MLQNIRNAIENGESDFFFDFQKAFTTVDNRIQLDKLYNYGIKGVAL